MRGDVLSCLGNGKKGKRRGLKAKGRDFERGLILEKMERMFLREKSEKEKRRRRFL